MDLQSLPREYEKENGFVNIDEEIVAYGRHLAEQICLYTPDVIDPKACMILFKKNNSINTFMKEDYHSAAIHAVELLEQGINSIIYTFQDYPPVIDHIVINEKK